MNDSAWLQRIPEMRALGDLLEGPSPAFARIRGLPGSGRSSLLRRATRGRRTVWLGGSPIPPSLHLRALRAALSAVGIDSELGDEHPWRAVMRALAETLDRDRTPLVVVLDDVEALPTPCVEAVYEELWTAARARGLPLWVLTAGDRTALSPTGPDAELELRLEDLDFRSVAEALPPGWSAQDKLLVWSTFGGRPAHLEHLDPGVRPATGIARAILDPEGPLHREGIALLERAVQKPDRYAGIIAALAEGAEDWPGIRARVPELAEGRGLAPYLRSLEELGILSVEQSLDARPTSRSRRYRLNDLFVAFWFGSVLPRLPLLAVASPTEIWRRGIRPSLEGHLERAFARACRQALASPPEALLPAPAREVGALWGEGYDLPAAGTLGTGAIVLGRCVWGRAATVEDAAAVRDAQRATRYGFGREARIRVVFAGGPVEGGLTRRAAREDLLRVVRLSDLTG